VQLAGGARGCVASAERMARRSRACAVVGSAKVCAEAVVGEQKSQWPQGRWASAVSPKWRMTAVMRHCWVSAKAAMRSICARRKAIWRS
jgi:hypothetical protein